MQARDSCPHCARLSLSHSTASRCYFVGVREGSTTPSAQDASHQGSLSKTHHSYRGRRIRGDVSIAASFHCGVSRASRASFWCSCRSRPKASPSQSTQVPRRLRPSHRKSSRCTSVPNYQLSTQRRLFSVTYCVLSKSPFQ